MNQLLKDIKYLVLTGNYGSGKTELALNLALRFSEQYRTTLVDLDIVNPYFRSGEAFSVQIFKNAAVVVKSGDTELLRKKSQILVPSEMVDLIIKKEKLEGLTDDIIVSIEEVAQ